MENSYGLRSWSTYDDEPAGSVGAHVRELRIALMDMIDDLPLSENEKHSVMHRVVGDIHYARDIARLPFRQIAELTRFGYFTGRPPA